MLLELLADVGAELGGLDHDIRHHDLVPRHAMNVELVRLALPSDREMLRLDALRRRRVLVGIAGVLDGRDQLRLIVSL